MSDRRQLYLEQFAEETFFNFPRVYRIKMEPYKFRLVEESPRLSYENRENAEHSVDNNNNYPHTPISCTHILSIRFQCVSCRENVCTECLFQFHKTCDFVPQRSYLRNLCLAKANELKKLIVNRLTELDKMESNFVEECSLVKTIIENRAEELISSIIAEKKILAEKLLLIKRTKINSYKMQAGWCHEALKSLHRMEEDSSKFKTFSALNRKVCSLVDELEKMELIREFNIYVHQDNKNSLGRITLSPYASKSTLEVCGKIFKNVMNTCIITVRNDLGEISSNDEHYTLCVGMVDEGDNPIYLLVENLKNGCFRVKFFPTTHGKHVLYATVNSAPILSCPREVDVSEGPNESSEPAVVFGKEGVNDGEFARAWGVCCDSQGRIFVADRCNHRIQIFAENGHFLYKFGKQGSGLGELNRPTGIAVDKFQRVIVADKDNHRIQIFDEEGIYITHFGNFGYHEDSLSYPWDVAVTKDCRIAVTETKKRRVRLFTDSGIELLRFTFRADMDLELPRGITVLRNGSFLITDFDKHMLVLLDEGFVRAQALGEKGILPQQFFRPQGVACNGNDLFAVSDCKNHRIQIFKNNVCYKIIGRNGNGYGEFDAPQGIAFHPDGRLIVVDCGNSRIQIFDVD